MKRYVICLRGKYSGIVHELDLAAFHTRREAGEFVEGLRKGQPEVYYTVTEEMTQWFVLDRRPWWRRIRSGRRHCADA